MLIQLCVMLLPLLGQSRGDTFTSIREMENLFDLEQSLVKALDNYLKHANFELEIMEMHYKELSKIESEIQDVEKYAENPVNAYSAIRRMHYDWPATFKLMSSSPFFEEQPDIPDESAVTEAIARLVQWQTEEKLETKTLARGLYKGIMPHANLTAFDCLEIAKYCYTDNKPLALQWLREALGKVEETGEGSATLLAQILEYTSLAKCLTDDFEGAVSAFQILISDGASWYTPSAKLKNDYKVDKVKKCEAAAKQGLKTKKPKPSSLFKRHDWTTELCGSPRRPTKPHAGLCYVIVDWRSAKFLKYESLDEEDIQILHGFIPQELILDIKQAAMEEFKTLSIEGLNGPVPLSNQELVAVVNKRFHNYTGVPVDLLAADHQIFVYGPGGKHESLNQYKKQVPGSRLVTFYVFLSDVARGGNLIFPDLKVSIEPAKGTVVFLPEMEDGLEVKECPVILGSKWTMTQSVVQKDD